MATVAHKHVKFLKRALVKELGNALAGSVFAALVLFVNGLLATAETGLGTELYQLFYFFKLDAHKIVYINAL